MARPLTRILCRANLQKFFSSPRRIVNQIVSKPQKEAATSLWSGSESMFSHCLAYSFSLDRLLSCFVRDLCWFLTFCCSLFHSFKILFVCSWIGSGLRAACCGCSIILAFVYRSITHTKAATLVRSVSLSFALCHSCSLCVTLVALSKVQ